MPAIPYRSSFVTFGKGRNLWPFEGPFRWRWLRQRRFSTNCLRSPLPFDAAGRAGFDTRQDNYHCARAYCFIFYSLIKKSCHGGGEILPSAMETIAFLNCCSDRRG